MNRKEFLKLSAAGLVPIFLGMRPRMASAETANAYRADDFVGSIGVNMKAAPGSYGNWDALVQKVAEAGFRHLVELELCLLLEVTPVLVAGSPDMGASP